MTARYSPGTWRVVLADRTVVMLDPSTPGDVVEAVWDAVVDGGGVAAVIRTLTGRFGADFGAIPPFAVAAPQRGGAAVAARGSVRVRVEGRDGALEVSGGEVTTWSERWIPDVRAVEVTPDAAGPGDGGFAGAPGLPLRSGVVSASSAWVPWEAGLARHVPDVASVTADRAKEPGPVPAPEPVAPPAAAPVPAPVAPEATPVPSPPAPDVTMTETPDGGMDHLWRTRLTTVEDAAVRESEEDEAAQGLAAHRAGAPAITAVPGMADPFAADHDGQTILSADLAAIREQRPGAGRSRAVAGPVAAPAVAGPSVLARLCPSGHGNPPEESRCRRCGQPLAQDAVQFPRPSLGRVMVSSGGVIDLDEPVVVGRAPKVGRVGGGDMPRPVVVPSPTREISGTHLAIRLEEWHVLVADLDSSNGTILRRPGQPPQRLQPRDAVLIRSGDVVDLGDGVDLTFEDLP